MGSKQQNRLCARHLFKRKVEWNGRTNVIQKLVCETDIDLIPFFDRATTRITVCTRFPVPVGVLIMGIGTKAIQSMQSLFSI